MLTRFAEMKFSLQIHQVEVPVPGGTLTRGRGGGPDRPLRRALRADLRRGLGLPGAGRADRHLPGRRPAAGCARRHCRRYAAGEAVAARHARRLLARARRLHRRPTSTTGGPRRRGRGGRPCDPRLRRHDRRRPARRDRGDRPARQRRHRRRYRRRPLVSEIVWDGRHYPYIPADELTIDPSLRAARRRRRRRRPDHARGAPARALERQHRARQRDHPHLRLADLRLRPRLQPGHPRRARRLRLLRQVQPLPRGRRSGMAIKWTLENRSENPGIHAGRHLPHERPVDRRHPPAGRDADRAGLRRRAALLLGREHAPPVGPRRHRAGRLQPDRGGRASGRRPASRR